MEQFPKIVQRVEEPSLESSETARAREIAGAGNYWVILEALKKEGLLENEMRRVREEYGARLERADFADETVWEILTVMELYDKQTAEHCVNTYEIVHEKVNKMLEHNVQLSENIRTDEDLSVENVELAALLHDVGKTEVLREVVGNRVTDDQCAKALAKLPLEEANRFLSRVPNFLIKENGSYAPEEILAGLQKCGARAAKISPIGLLWKLEGQDINICEEKLIKQNKGYDRNTTLGELLQAHEESSGAILEQHQFPPVVAAIAEHHHNYRNEKLHFPIAEGTVGLSNSLGQTYYMATNFLHLVDEKQALESTRHYKSAFSDIKIWDILKKDASEMGINKELTCLFLEDEIGKSREYAPLLEKAKQNKKIRPKDWKEIAPSINDEEKQKFEAIVNFILEEEDKIADLLENKGVFYQKDETTEMK